MSNYKAPSIIATVFIIVVYMLAGTKTADASDGPLKCVFEEIGKQPVRIGGGLRAMRYSLKLRIINNTDRTFTLYASGMNVRSWHTLYDTKLKAYYWNNGDWEILKNDMHIPTRDQRDYELKIHADDPEPYKRVISRNPTTTTLEDPFPAFIYWSADYRDQYGHNQTVECSWSK